MKEFSLIIAILAGFFGWGLNLYKLTECDFEAPYKCEVLRLVGVIPPIGAGLGYIDIEGK